MNGIYNLGLEKFPSSLGMRGFVGVWRPLTCGNRPVEPFHIALFPKAKLDFVTKLSRIHGNIMRTNQVTGAPEDEGVFTAISPSQTCANYYISHAPSIRGCRINIFVL